MQNYFKPGCWNVICSVCGRKVKSDQIKKRWDGVLVCEDDFDIRHPLDFIRGITDNSSIPYSNPEPTDNYISVVYLISCQADIAQADHSEADVVFQ